MYNQEQAVNHGNERTCNTWQLINDPYWRASHVSQINNFRSFHQDIHRQQLSNSFSSYYPWPLPTLWSGIDLSASRLSMEDTNSYFVMDSDRRIIGYNYEEMSCSNSMAMPLTSVHGEFYPRPYTLIAAAPVHSHYDALSVGQKMTSANAASIPSMYDGSALYSGYFNPLGWQSGSIYDATDSTGTYLRSSGLAWPSHTVQYNEPAIRTFCTETDLTDVRSVGSRIQSGRQSLCCHLINRIIKQHVLIFVKINNLDILNANISCICKNESM